MPPRLRAAGSGRHNVRLSEYRGQPVILSFWSSGCSTCAKQLATLDKLYGTYRSAGLVVFGVSVDDNLPRAQQYATRTRLRIRCCWMVPRTSAAHS
jgi:peroxiredoxin